MIFFGIKTIIMATEFERFQGYVPSRRTSLEKRIAKNAVLIASFENNIEGSSPAMADALQKKIDRLQGQTANAEVSLTELQVVAILQSGTAQDYAIDEGNENGELVSMQRKRVNRKVNLETLIAMNRDLLIPSLQDDLATAEGEAKMFIEEEIENLQRSMDNAEESLGELAFIEIKLA